MDKDFADVIRRMVSEQGKETLVNGRAKIFLADYCKGQFKKEMKIFRQILESGCGEHVNSADSFPERKLKLMERLEDEDGLSQKVTSDYLDLLCLILKGKIPDYEAVVVQKAPPKQPRPVPRVKVVMKGPPKPRIRRLINNQTNFFVQIPGGTFLMGSPINEPGHKKDEGPQHKVTVTGFFMSRYQVTQKEYQEVMGKNPSHIKGGMLPVECVCWYDAVEYCNELSLRHGLSPAYTIDINLKDPNNQCNFDLLKWTVTWDRNAKGYRLPTEAEWEYACRAGTTEMYNTSIIDDTGWYNVNSYNMIHPVGQKSPNAWGLYDMHGNAEEWCWDWYSTYLNKAQNDPEGAVSGSGRIRRGGSVNNRVLCLRSAYRNHKNPHIKNQFLGFRIVHS
jgi:formylglycine-generating enzyme required for sulfatase activity